MAFSSRLFNLQNGLTSTIICIRTQLVDDFKAEKQTKQSAADTQFAGLEHRRISFSLRFDYACVCVMFYNLAALFGGSSELENRRIGSRKSA